MQIHGEFLLKSLAGEECPHADVEMDAALGPFGCCWCRGELFCLLKLRTLAVKLVLTQNVHEGASVVSESSSQECK